MRPKPAESRSARANRNATTKEFDKKGGETDNCQPKKQDLSVLRRPVDTSICGLKDAVKVFETGTPEMLHLLSYECDIVYECRVCRNMFRSLANFISHKRVYCRQRYSPSKDLFRSHDTAENYTVLTDMQMDGEELPARITARRDLTSIVESLSGHLSASQFYADAGEKVAARNEARKDTTIHLQPIENTSYGVFQTVLNTPSKGLIKNQVTELQSLMSEKDVILGPDGRIVGNGIDRMPKKDQNQTNHQKEHQTTSTTNKLICPTCNAAFSTRKTLVQHTRKLHDLTKICYTCPCCKNLFANTWSVYRHLYKVHRKSNEQVRRLRSQIQKKEVKIERKVPPENTKKNVTEQQRRDEENKAWMEHFEDDSELQRCGGCGRRFERKAALTSHSQICQKRIAAFRIQREPDNHTKLLSSGNLTPVLTPTPCKTEPKKIGIQVRMNYCKTNAHGSSAVMQYNEKTDNRCLIDRESDIEVKSIDSKDAVSSNSSFKEYDKTRPRNSLDHLIQNSGTVDKVQVYLNNTTSGIKSASPLSQFKNFRRHQSSQISKIGSLEAKCLQLRNSLQNKVEKCSDDELSSDISELSNKELGVVKNNDLIVQKEEIIMKTLNNEVEEENIKEGIAVIDDEIDLVTDDEAHSMKGCDPDDEIIVSSANKTELMDADSQSDIEKCENAEPEIIISDTSIEEINEADDSKADISDAIVSNTAMTRTELMDADSQSDIGNADAIYQNNKVLGVSLKSKTLKENTNMQLNVKLMEKKISQYIRPRRMQCLICMKRFQKLRYLRKHIAAHVGWHRYRCLVPMCTFSSFSSSDCIAHLIKVHLGSTDKSRAYSMVGEITPDEWNCSSGTEKSFHLIRSKILKAKHTLRHSKKNLVSVSTMLKKAETKNSKSLLNDQTSCNGKTTESVDKQKRLKAETVADSSTGKEDEKLFTVNVVSDSGSDMSVTTDDEEEEEEEAYELEEDETEEEDEDDDGGGDDDDDDEEEDDEEKEVPASKIPENMVADKTGNANDSHVRKMVMEVIFGSSVPPPNISPSVTQHTLPARNRVQFRHNDFLYENDKKINGNLRINKRANKTTPPNTEAGKTSMGSVKK